MKLRLSSEFLYQVFALHVRRSWVGGVGAVVAWWGADEYEWDAYQIPFHSHHIGGIGGMTVGGR